MAGVALTLVLGGLGIAVFVTAVTPHGSTTVIAPEHEPTTAPASVEIYVHILGQVVRPGLYALPDGARAVDAVAAAGGFTETADAGGVNLARFVSDGEQIVVPAIGETPTGGAPGIGGDGRVNLNTADAAALDTLPGIGPATAQKDGEGLYRFLVGRGVVADKAAAPVGPFTGKGVPQSYVEMVRAPVGGMAFFHVKPGDVVKAGQLIAELIPVPGDLSAVVPVHAKAPGLVLTRVLARAIRVGDDLVKIVGDTRSVTAKDGGALES